MQEVVLLHGYALAHRGHLTQTATKDVVSSGEV